MSFFVYMLRCTDGTLYSGMARDVQKRFLVHTKGKGSKYVAARLPASIVYVEGPFLTQGDALRRELTLKKMTRSQKEILIKQA